MIRKIIHPKTVAAMRCANADLQANEQAQSMVEFAISLPCLMLVVTGVLYFSLVLFQDLTLHQAAQVSMRQLAVARGQTTDPCATVYGAIASSSGMLNPSKLTISMTLNGTAYTGTTCQNAVASMVIGAPAQINLSYPVKLVLAGDVISNGFSLYAQEKDKLQ